MKKKTKDKIAFVLLIIAVMAIFAMVLRYLGVI